MTTHLDPNPRQPLPGAVAAADHVAVHRSEAPQLEAQELRRRGRQARLAGAAGPHEHQRRGATRCGVQASHLEASSMTYIINIYIYMHMYM